MNYFILAPLLIITTHLFLADSVYAIDPSSGPEAQCGLPMFTDRNIAKNRAYYYKNTSWKTGGIIPVYFLNGSAEQRIGVEHSGMGKIR